MSALSPDLHKAFATAAKEWRREHAKPTCAKQPPPADALSNAMRVDFVHELLDTIPREAVAAQLFIEVGDDDHAHEHLTKLIMNVRELARTWNESRRAESEAAP